jgi:2-polyprenyl-3-methyl-5-hydroxy-6-metoxy-1,4-benzoquinol methylase
MSERYFGTARREILPWLPQRVERMLDLGCGSGATVAMVRERRKVAWAGGVEFVASEAARAQAVCERVWSIDVEREAFEREIPEGTLDLVLCLDVLEHLVDPWTVVKRLSPLLRPGGRLIVSVPNIRNWKFISGLLLRGDFRYREAGLLDRTHLRFFTADTAIELATCGGLRLAASVGQPLLSFPDARWFLSRLTFRAADALLAKQCLVISEV